MPGVRMSGLPIARFCGQANRINVGAGRAAALSSAFHALCSNGVDKDAKLARLTAEEREEIATWSPPADVLINMSSASYTLRYSEAVTELEVAITDSAGACKGDDPKAISVGHLDMAWVITFPDGKKVVYVADIKKTQWTTLDGPDSLQLIGYAFAFGALHGADAYCCGIWQATEGQWHWGDIVDFDSDTAMRAWDDLYHAAQNVGGDFATGPHCSGCWSRFQCPAHLLPPEMAETSLAPLCAGKLQTNADALKLLQLKKRAEDTLKVADEFLKDFAKHHGGIDDGAGKSWRAVECQGREGFDKKKFAEEHPELSAKYTKRGASYEQYRWTKVST